MTQQLDDEYTAIHMGERLRKNPLANLGHSLTDKIGSQSSGLHLLDILTDSNHDIINYIMLNDPDVSDGMHYGAREHFPERVSQEYADQLKSEVKSAQQGALQKLQR